MPLWYINIIIKSIYQFLISTQHVKQGFGISELKDKDGNLTGHLMGIFNRSIQLMENGIRPVWVFDGKPPDLKKRVLEERKKKKQSAEVSKSEAVDTGNFDKALKFANQSVKITTQMLDDAKNLIRLLGVPVIEAPSEAEAQCSILAKGGKVHSVASEDLDCLTFGAPILLRNFSSKDEPVTEIKLELVLKGLNLEMDSFIDLCILCGCDYTDNIDGIGAVKAYKLICEYKNIENVIKYVDEYNNDPKKKRKLIYDKDKFYYETSRTLFKSPETLDPEKVELVWKEPDFEGLKKFLTDERGFDPKRIESASNRIKVINRIT